MNRLPYWLWPLTVVLAGLAAWGVGMQPWWTVPDTEMSLSGSQVTQGTTSAVGLLAAAAGAMSLVITRWWRTVIAVCAGLAGVGTVLVGIDNHPPSTEQLAAVAGPASLGGTQTADPTVWHWVFVALGIVVIAAAAVTGRTRRPARSADRFDRATVNTDAAQDDPREMWKAIDNGIDPTDPDQRAD